MKVLRNNRKEQVKIIIMSNIISCEAVSAGHPDKICDQIADAVVTDCLKRDKDSRVAIEVLIKDYNIVIAGELTCAGQTPDYHKIVDSVFKRIGKDRLGYNPKKFNIRVLVSRQSKDIALGVDKGGAGDQGMMYGYATNETPELLPIPFVLATRLLEKLEAYGYESKDERIKADAKAQITFDYDNWKIVTFLCSVQTARDISQSDFRAVKKIVTGLMKDVAAERALNTDFQVLINPTGRFEVGGPFADCGVTGRKLACDTYGGVGHIGGGAMCVDGDTEFLTPHGWKLIRSFEDGDLVGQWEDGELSFVKPDAYIVNKANGLKHIRSAEVIDMVLSPNHDVVLETSKGGIIKKAVKLLFDDRGVKSGNHGFIPTSFKYKNDSSGIDLSDDLIRIQVAFCADGSLLQNNNKRWTGRIRVKKQCKKQRIRYLLNKTGLNYKETSDGDFSIFYLRPPFKCKLLSDCLMGANTSQLKVIADEVQLWDGEDRHFRTTIKADADFIQFAFMTAYETNATISVDDRVGESYFRDGNEYIRKSILYQVHSTKWTKFQIKHGQKCVGHCSVTPYTPADGLMYCFSVPSGILVLRRNNRVFITGNSGKDCSKVDRSGAYMARKIARDIVRAGYADKCEVQIAYAIGVVKPVSVHVECFGTEHQEIGFIEEFIDQSYDLTPKGIIKKLKLLDVDYRKVSAYGHFGKKGLPWEK